MADTGLDAVSGKVRAMNTLSPVIPERERQLRWRLWLVSHLPFLNGPLGELVFIHYARWSIFRWLPKSNGSGVHEPLKSSYLFFDSNFNGSQAEYLDAFTGTVPGRLLKLWGTCLTFDETVKTDPADPMPPGLFRDYVKANQLEILHFFAAYPEHQVVNVRQAIAIGDETKRVPRTQTRRDALARRVLPLVLGPQVAIGPKITELRRSAAAQVRAITRRFGVNPLTLVVPVADEQLVRRIERWPTEDSPLERLPDTHFARFIHLPRTMMDLGQRAPDDLGADYLIFTSQYMGSEAGYLKALANELGDVWDGCVTADGLDRLEWLRRHRVKTTYFVSGYPPRPVDRIKRDLHTRRRLAEDLHEEPTPTTVGGPAGNGGPPRPVTWAWIERGRRPS